MRKYVEQQQLPFYRSKTRSHFNYIFTNLINSQGLVIFIKYLSQADNHYNLIDTISYRLSNDLKDLQFFRCRARHR